MESYAYLYPDFCGAMLKIHAMNVIESRIHSFLESHPKDFLLEAVSYLKGGSSYRFFKVRP